MNKINIVLVEPEIPQNTGNIARTCACTGAAMHIVKPTLFEITDKNLKRAGLDYWHLLDITYYESLDEFLAINCDKNLYFLTTKGRSRYTDIKFSQGDFIVFGKESRGLPEELLVRNPKKCFRIPMAEGARSLNLSNAAAIVTYEALRQMDFTGLEAKGELTRFKW